MPPAAPRLTSFVRRRINVTIGVGLGKDGAEGVEWHKLPSGLRISAQIVKAGGDSMGSADVRIFGMTLEFMNRLSSLELTTKRARNNRVVIEAGDDVGGMAKIFEGHIWEAWQDFGGMPETSFSIQAFAGVLAALKPVPPTSIQGYGNAITALAGLATLANLKFENNYRGGVLLPQNSYFSGTARDQIMAACDAANIGCTIDDDTLIVYNKDGARRGPAVPVNRDTGMVGFPSIGAQNNIKIKTLFNKAIRYRFPVEVKSVITPACGIWVLYLLSYALESETPDGQWFMEFEASPLGVSPPVV